jgi:hypothetical protein
LDIVYYNLFIYVCFSVIAILGLLSFIDLDLNIQNWFNLAIGSTVSIILFIIALRIDKASTLKMFALLDEDKRKILELLDVERSLRI